MLVIGGGTGAEFLNTLVANCMPQLSKSVQIIHSTGKNKPGAGHSDNYHAYEFIDNMADAYAVADIVVCRAGVSTLTELSNLKKLTILVPIPQSHQELNALFMAHLDAAIVLKQDKIKTENFISLIRRLLFAGQAQESLKNNIAKIMPHNANQKISEIILKLAERN